MITMMFAALGYAELGWPVFPCVPEGKEPLTRNGFKNATTDPDMIRHWWSRWPNANPATATGAPGPDVIDIDTKHGRSGLDLYRKAWRAGHLRAPVAVVRTPSGGLHLWFEGTDQRGGAVGRDKAMELKAVGGYVLLPPAQVTVLGVGGYHGTYQLIERSDNNATVDFPAVRDTLTPARRPTEAAARYQRKEGETSPGDDYNRRGSWFQLLTRHRWTFATERGRVQLWRRPDKDHGVSATINALGTNRLHVFTSSTEFDPGTSYNKFAAFAVLECGGSYSTAARILADAGYGSPRQKVAA